MSKYSNKLRQTVIDFVIDERVEEQDRNYIPMECALHKVDFPNDFEKFETDWLDEDDFLLDFKDIIKIIDNAEGEAWYLK